MVQTDRQPLRVIIDPNNRVSPSAKLLNDGNPVQHLTENFRGLPALLDMLGDMEIQRLVIEGGPTTINYFLEDGLVDEFIHVISEVNHFKPVPSNFDLSSFSKVETSNWGIEKVKIYTK